MIGRRRLTALLSSGLMAPATWALAADTPVAAEYPVVRPGARLSFPADHGAHPLFRTEWWYVTGWLRTPDGRDLGFQVTFFRSRPDVDQRNPSAFSPRQIVFAHAALSDPAVGHLLHDQRIARAGFGLADAAVGDTRLVLDDWRLQRDAAGVFRTHAGGGDFTLDLAFTPTQPILLQGDQGFSRKGQGAGQASYYYSLPHLRVGGSIVQDGRRVAVTGEAWLDREWSSTLLDARAVGWDWVGLNLDDGAALTAFQVRGADGSPVWAGGSLRAPGGAVAAFKPQDVAFTTVRSWTSRRTRAVYPVERLLRVQLPGGPRSWPITPLFDDQELDSRKAGGPVYWEGAARTTGGRGYLELTGYAAPITV